MLEIDETPSNKTESKSQINLIGTNKHKQQVIWKFQMEAENYEIENKLRFMLSIDKSSGRKNLFAFEKNPCMIHQQVIRNAINPLGNG